MTFCACISCLKIGAMKFASNVTNNSCHSASPLSSSLSILWHFPFTVLSQVVYYVYQHCTILCTNTYVCLQQVHLRKHPSHLQKIINIFLQWQNSVNRDANRDVSRLKEAVRPLLRGQQHLLEEFCWFFCDEQPPQRYVLNTR